MMLRLFRTGWLVRGGKLTVTFIPQPGRMEINWRGYSRDLCRLSHSHLYSAQVSSILLHGPSTDVTSFSHANDHSSREN